MFSGIFSSCKFKQHYLGNKKPIFLACNTEQVYAAILESSEINDLFQNRQIYFAGSLEFPEISLTWFL